MKDSGNDGLEKVYKDINDFYTSIMPFNDKVRISIFIHNYVIT